MTARYPSFSEAVQAHNQRLSKVCPMPVNRWRVLKSLLNASFLAVVAVTSMKWDVNQTFVWLLTIMGIIVMFVGDVKEIQVASIISTTFKNGHRQEDEQDNNE